MRVEVARRTPEQGPGTMLFPQCASPSSFGPSSSSASSTISGPSGSSSTSVSGSTSKTPTPIPIMKHSSKAGTFAAVVVGGIAAISLLVAALLFYRRRRRSLVSSTVRRVAYARVRRRRCIHRIQPTDGVPHIFSSIVQLNLFAATQAHAYPGRLTV